MEVKKNQRGRKWGELERHKWKEEVTKSKMQSTQ